MVRRPSTRSLVITVATCLALAGGAWAQDKNAGVKKTFVIEAVDAQKRLLTLKAGEGGVEVIAVGPAVPKFNDLKVGDKVEVRYFEPMLLGLKLAGQPAAQAAGEPASPTEVTATATVAATDPKVPSVSLKTDEGQSMTFQVGDKKLVETLKAGDKVDITYMRPMAFKVDKK